MAPSNRYSCLPRPDLLLTDRVSIPHPLYGKGHPETPIKCCSRSNGRIKSYGPFEPLLLPGATKPPQRVSIPHPLYGKGHPETPIKFCSRSNGRIKSYSPFELLLLPGATRPPLHRVSIPHPLYRKGHPETPINLDRDLMVESKLIAFTNRSSSLARPDVLLTEYRFHIHYMEKGIRKHM